MAVKRGCVVGDEGLLGGMKKKGCCLSGRVIKDVPERGLHIGSIAGGYHG